MSVTGRSYVALLTLFASGLLVDVDATACPFCGGPQLTLKERSAESDVVVLARYLRTEIDSQEEDEQDVFRVEQVLKGSDHVPPRTLVHVEPGESLTVNQTCLLFAVNSIDLRWGDPIPASTAACDYLLGAPDIKASIKTRLKYYVQFLEHRDEAITVDAFDFQVHRTSGKTITRGIISPMFYRRVVFAKRFWPVSGFQKNS